MKEIIDYSKEEIGTQIGEYKIEQCQTCGRNGIHVNNPGFVRFDHIEEPDEKGAWLLLLYWI